MALSQKNLDKSIWSLILRDQKRKEEEEEEEEEKKKMKEEEEDKKKKSMETNLEYGIAWITWISCIDTCLWVVGCRKLNPRINCCMEIIKNPFVFLGFCYEKT